MYDIIFQFLKENLFSTDTYGNILVGQSQTISVNLDILTHCATVATLLLLFSFAVWLVVKLFRLFARGVSLWR